MPRAYSLNRVSGACAVLCIAISALLLGKPSFSNASLPVRGISDPVIAIQAARSITDVDYVLGDAPSADREVMRVKQHIGFAFIASYTALFFSLSLGLLRSGGVGRIAGMAAIICTAATAAFNVASNLAVLRILDVPLFQTTGGMINAIRSAGFASWALAALTLLLLSIYFFRSPRWAVRSIGVLFLVTALMQFYGLRDGEFLVLSSVPAGIALVGIVATTLVWRGSAVSRLAVVLMIVGASVHAEAKEIKEVRTYRTQEPRDRGVLFAMTVTPDQDVLSFVAKKDGIWRLTRIQNWLDKSPYEQTIDVPGIVVPENSKNPPTFLSMLSADLVSTPDRSFAVSISTGYWANNGQRGGMFDRIVSVIDLRKFGVVNTVHQNGILAYYTDREGHLVTEEIAFSTGQRQINLKVFALPDLTIIKACHFSETLAAGTWIAGTWILHDQDCGPSLQELLDGLVNGHNFPRNHPLDSFAGMSRTGRFRLEGSQNLHKNFWGNPVVTEAHLTILSAETGTTIGVIKENTRETVDAHWSELNGHDYLILMESSTQLKVYDLTSSTAP